MFNEIYLAIKQATKIDDLKKNIVLNIDKRKEDNPLITVAAQLAKDGEIVKLDWLRRLGADVHVIAQGYAIAANHEQVEIYRTKFNADVDIIAHGYAIAGNHKYVQIYHKKYKANIDLIAVGYAIAGNLELVEICRTQYKADIDLIAYGYALSEGCCALLMFLCSHGNPTLIYFAPKLFPATRRMRQGSQA